MSRNYKFHKELHQYPVVEGLVFKPENYVCSSAIDYSGENRVLDDVIVIR